MAHGGRRRAFSRDLFIPHASRFPAHRIIIHYSRTDLSSIYLRAGAQASDYDAISPKVDTKLSRVRLVSLAGVLVSRDGRDPGNFAIRQRQRERGEKPESEYSRCTNILSRFRVHFV